MGPSHLAKGLAVAVVTVALWASPAAAQQRAPADSVTADDEPVDAELLSTLNERVVSGASRVSESLEAAPVTASTLQADELRRFGVQTLAEALRFLSVGMFDMAGTTSLQQTTGARGVAVSDDSNRHIVVLIDGSVATSDVGILTGWALGLPLELVDTIEVILGPGSVLYGGNAMLAVIVIHTKAARHIHGVRVITEAGASPAMNASGRVKGFDGAGTSPRFAATVGETFSFLGQDGELTGAVEAARRTLPDVDIPNQQQPTAVAPGGFTVPPFGGTLHGVTADQNEGGYARLKLGRLSVDAQLSHGRMPQAGTLSGEVLDATRTSWDSTVARADAQVGFDFTPRLSGFARTYLLATIYDGARYGEVGQSNACPAGGTPGSRCLLTHDFHANHQGTELQANWDVAGDGEWQVLAGVDGRLRQAADVVRAQDNATLKYFAPLGAFDAKGVTVAGYGQLRAEPFRWFGVNVGLRYDWFHDAASGLAQAPRQNPVTSATLPSMEGSALSPRGGVVITPVPSTTIHASVGRAFRAPSTIERYTTSAIVELAGPLQPETVLGGEVGVKQRLGAHRALLTGFVSSWEGLLGLGNGRTLGRLRFQDTGSIENYGFDAALEGSFLVQRLQYAASFTWGYARERSRPPDLTALPPVLADAVRKASAKAVETIELVGAPEVSGNARVSYAFDAPGPTVGLAAAVYGPRLTSFAYSNVLAIAPGTHVPAFGYNWRSNLDPKLLDPSVEVRATVSGPVPWVSALRYRVMGSYLFTPAFEPLAYGPTPGRSVPTVGDVPGAVPVPRSTGQLFPTTALTLLAGLELVIDP